MWECNNCLAHGDPDGYRRIRDEVVSHLVQGDCASATLTYGGPRADRTIVDVSKDAGGKVHHSLRPETGWRRVPEGVLVKRPYAVREAWSTGANTVTLAVESPGPGPRPWAAGQFCMVGAYGFGEVPISISGGSGQDGAVMEFTVRNVGRVTDVLTAAKSGDTVTVRGPFGRGWRLSPGDDDLLLVAGGCGLAPLRPVVVGAGLTRRRVTLLYGAKTRDELLFADEYAEWEEAGVDVRLITDPYGFAPSLVPKAGVREGSTLALICGPEPMMREAAAMLADVGVPPSKIQVSMERHMQCGFGVCGKCHVGRFTVCEDGPVFTVQQLKSRRSPKDFLSDLLRGGLS